MTACLVVQERTGLRLSDVALPGHLLLSWVWFGTDTDGNLTGIQIGVPGTGLNPLLYLSILFRTRPIG